MVQIFCSTHRTLKKTQAPPTHSFYFYWVWGDLFLANNFTAFYSQKNCFLFVEFPNWFFQVSFLLLVLWELEFHWNWICNVYCKSYIVLYYNYILLYIKYSIHLYMSITVWLIFNESMCARGKRQNCTLYIVFNIHYIKDMQYRQMVLLLLLQWLSLFIFEDSYVTWSYY